MADFAWRILRKLGHIGRETRGPVPNKVADRTRNRKESQVEFTTTTNHTEPRRQHQDAATTDANNSQSCNICKGLSKPGGPDSQFLAVGPIKTEDLSMSMRAGCPTCKLLLEGSIHFAAGESISSISIKPAAPSQLINVYVKTKKGSNFSIEFYTEVGSPKPFPNIDFAHRVSPTAGSDECVQWAADTISHCVTNHPWCQLPKETPLPTRVVDVGSESRNPRIQISNGGSGRYAALSHCWGKVTPLKLTRDSLESMRQGIRPSSLPPLFLDAIFLARRLGIPYIWIDSLCIIQDDRDDWEREAVKMGDVYADAWVVFTAHTAKDSSESILSAPRVRDTQSVALECEGLNGIRGTVHARLARTSSYLIDRTHGHSRARFEDHTLEGLQRSEVSLLSRRGWVFQERKLATRTIHFTRWEAVWECGTQIRCECGYSPQMSSDGRVLKRNFTGPQSVHPVGTLAGGFSTEISQLMLRGVGTGSADLRDEWPRLVEGFTALSLTFDDDRLPAMAGLASSTKRLTSAEYVYGLWSDDLPRGLLWASARGGSKSRRHLNLPSWSWASVTGPIQAFLDPTFMFQIEILEYRPAALISTYSARAENKEIRLTGPFADGHFTNIDSSSDSAHSMFSYYDSYTNSYWRICGRLQLDVGEGLAELSNGEPCSLLLGAIGRSGVILWLVVKKQNNTRSNFERVGRLFIMEAHRNNWLFKDENGRVTSSDVKLPSLLNRVITLV